MPSGSPLGYGDEAGRVRSQVVSLAAIGFTAIEFTEEYVNFAFQVSGGAPAAGSVLVGFGVPEQAAIDRPSIVQDVIDPFSVGGVWNFPRKTRWVYVYVNAATPGASLRVSGLEGAPALRPPTGAEVAAAMAAVTLAISTAAVPVVWGAPALVAMGAASAVILAANAARKAFAIQNTGVVDVAVRPAAAAALFATDWILRPGDAWEEPLNGRLIYTGELRGITDGGVGELRVVEGI